MTRTPAGYDTPVPPRWPGTPPTAEYLAERQTLGFPSRALALSRTCPWCGAGPYTECTVKATGYRLPIVHDERAVPLLDSITADQP